MDTATVKYAREEDTITIEPLFDLSQPKLCPDKLQYKKMLQELQADTWPRTMKQLAVISADFGRSHYFFTDHKDSIAQAVHKYCFATEDEIPNKDREEFLAKFSIKGESIVTDLSSPSPTRSAIITRVKYEMLKNYLAEQGLTQVRASKIALQGMYLATQDYLAWIKFSSLQALEKEFPSVKVTFAFFQSDIWVDKENRAFLTITLINTKPESGAWQSIGVVPTDNKKCVKAECTLALNLNKSPIDPGKVVLIVGKKHPKWKKKISKESKAKIWGIYNADSRTCLKFKDTAPTW